MAPKRNQAKAQRGSFLTRGREQLRQRQQTRQQSSRQLPPEGGTTAGSLKARGQRTATAVQQKVQRDVAATRALADMMQRNQARADRQIPADKSPSVRRVGPGGANPKPQGQLPPGQRGGDMRQKGGPLAQRQSSAMTERSREISRGNTVSQVKVQDLGNRTQAQIRGQRDLPGGTGGADRVTGSGTRTGQPGPNRNALPAGQRGGELAKQPSARRQAAQAKADAAARGSQGPNRVGQPEGSANRMYGANRVNAAVDRAMSQQRGTRANVAGAVVSALAQPLVDRAAARGGRNLAKALTPVGRAIDDALPGMNSKDERSRKTNTPYQTRFPQARANAQTRVNRIKAGIPDAAPQTPQPAQRTSTPPIASSGGGGGGYQGVSGRISPGVRGTSPMGSSTPMQGVAASESYRDGGKGLYQGSEAYRAAMKAKDPNSSGNPLLDRMRSTMASANYASQRQETNGVGPVANPMQYANSLTRGKGTTGIGPINNGTQYAASLGRTTPDVAPPAPVNARIASASAPKPPTKKDEPKPRATTSRSSRRR